MGVLAIRDRLVTIGALRGRRFRAAHLRRQSMSGPHTSQTTGFPGWTPAGAELILSPYELVPARGLWVSSPAILAIGKKAIERKMLRLAFLCAKCEVRR